MISVHYINKSHAMNVSTYKSTGYTKKTIQGEVKAEARFPQGKLIFATCLLILLIATSAQAKSFYHQVENDVLAYAQLQQWHDFSYDIAIWLPNKAQQLPQCDNSITFKSATPDRAPLARVSYLISCTQPKWKMRAYAKVKVWLDIWHAKTDISANQQLTAAQLQLKRADISSLTQGFVTDAQQLLNQRNLRRIRAGRAISPQQVERPFLVTRGDEVIIRASTGGFVATMKGKALQSGKKGDKILIQNLSSNKRIQAKVASDGIVETLF